MTTHEENGNVESIQPQVALIDNLQEKINKGMEDLSLKQASREDTKLDGKELGKLENNNEPSREPVQVPQSGLPSKNENLAVPGGEELIESDQARIERLGRERPAKFKSLGAELAFCYSIIASQFMAVCINVLHCRRMLETNFPDKR